MTTLTKTVLQTEAIPLVDIDFMNNTHFEEITMVQALGELITAYQQHDNPSVGETQMITESLENWLQHTQAHFERENALMRITNFPVYQIHAGEHETALEQMSGIVKTWQQNNDIDQLAGYIFSLWPAWFSGHVDSMDMVTARFAVMNGFDPHSNPQDLT